MHTTTGKKLTLQEYLKGCKRGWILREKGLTVGKIAEKLNVSSTTVSRTIYGDLRPAWLRIAIAQLAGIEFKEFWGEPEPDFTAEPRRRLEAAGLSL